MRRQDPSQIPGRHDPGGDWEEVGATARNLVGPPTALGRPLCAVWEHSKHTPAEDLTRRWAHGPANYWYWLLLSALACAVHKGPPCEVSGGLECRPSRARTWVWRLPAWPMLLRAYNGTITASGRIVGWLVCQNDVNIIWCFGYPTAHFNGRVECSQTH